MVDPALHLEAVAAQLADAEGGGPAVVDQRAHGDFGPVVGAFAVREQRGGDGVVAVGEDVGFDADLVADGALGGEASGIDCGVDAFNDDALASVGFSQVLHWPLRVWH